MNCIDPCRIAGADIKDKQPLMDTRRSIERDMERFKACEREMKLTGRAGMAKPSDPKEKAKDDAREWINNSVEALTAKVGAKSSPGQSVLCSAPCSVAVVRCYALHEQDSPAQRINCLHALCGAARKAT